MIVVVAVDPRGVAVDGVALGVAGGRALTVLLELTGVPGAGTRFFGPFPFDGTGSSSISSFGSVEICTNITHFLTHNLQIILIQIMKSGT